MRRMNKMIYTHEMDLRLAELSALVYEDYEEVLRRLGNRLKSWFSEDDTQAMIVEDTAFGMTAVVFRGTQVTGNLSWADIATNLYTSMTPWPVGGMVHAGYAEAALDVSGKIWAQLQYVKTRPLVYTGHSLGGVLATLMSTFEPNPDATVTFGAPKAGDADFCKYVPRPFRRYVFGNDFAPFFPLCLSGFRHPTKKIRLGTRRGIPSVAAHSVSNYIAALKDPNYE